MIEYKGYIARVEFAETADVFHGRVVNSGPYPVVTFETTRAGALRQAQLACRLRLRDALSLATNHVLHESPA